MFLRYLIYIFKSLAGLIKDRTKEMGETYLPNCPFDNDKNNDFQIILAYRKKLLVDQSIIKVKEFGAGARRRIGGTKRVCDVAKLAGSRKSKLMKLYTITRQFHPEVVVELGTSLGISALCLSLAAKNSRLITLEADRGLHDFAKSGLRQLNRHNIEFLNSLFDDALEKTLTNNLNKRLLVFIDGNHLYKPSIRYYHLIKKHFSCSALVIIDDINWSAGMQRAWKEIKNDRGLRFTREYFDLGIVGL